MNKNKFEINKRLKRELPRDILYKKYTLETKSCFEIAKEVNCDRTTVWKYLKKYGIPRRKNRGSWKGGRRKSKSGHHKYWIIYSPNHHKAMSNKYVFEHTLIAEKMLGRHLKQDEIVHHIDGNTLNNNTDNLWICNPCRHRKAHGSFSRLLTVLFENGTVIFEKGEYQLND